MLLKIGLVADPCNILQDGADLATLTLRHVKRGYSQARIDSAQECYKFISIFFLILYLAATRIRKNWRMPNWITEDIGVFFI